MADTAAKDREEIDEELAAAVRAGWFATEEDALREAVQALFAAKPHLRVEAAIQRFRDGEITLGRAAELAGMTRWRFQELLALRGVPIEIEARSVAELDAAVAKLQRQHP